jgi:TolB-like protein/Tfp pilus assembly protein PilF
MVTTPTSHPPQFQKFVIAAVGLLMIAGVSSLFLFKRDLRSPPISQTLAILPFKPLVVAERDESLELGMADTLIATLSQSADHTVRPLSSVRRFTAVDQDAISAGRELDADIVLDGSIQRQGDRLRVSVRLLRVSDAKQLWAKTFDQRFTDIFAVQDVIATTVAMELPQWKMAGAPPSRRYTNSPEAYANYASGQLMRARYTEPRMRQAIVYFEKAIELDPNYALAYIGIADCYATMGVFEMARPHEVWPLARKAVDQALSIDSELAAAYATSGHIKVQYEYKFDAAERDYARAIALDPRHASAYFNRAMLYSIRGEGEKGLEDLARGIELEPYLIGPRAARGHLLTVLGRYDEAITAMRRTLELEERADNARGFLIRAYIAKGDYDQALAEIPERHLSVQFGYSFKAQVYALSGRRNEAITELNRLLALAKQQYIQAMNFAAIYVALGDADNAFLWLDRAVDDRSTHVPQLATSPVFASLRGDPRFAKLLDRIGMNKRKRE